MNPGHIATPERRLHRCTRVDRPVRDGVARRPGERRDLPGSSRPGAAEPEAAPGAMRAPGLASAVHCSARVACPGAPDRPPHRRPDPLRLLADQYAHPPMGRGVPHGPHRLRQVLLPLRRTSGRGRRRVGPSGGRDGRDRRVPAGSRSRRGGYAPVSEPRLFGAKEGGIGTVAVRLKANRPHSTYQVSGRPGAVHTPPAPTQPATGYQRPRARPRPGPGTDRPCPASSTEHESALGAGA